METYWRVTKNDLDGKGLETTNCRNRSRSCALYVLVVSVVQKRTKNLDGNQGEHHSVVWKFEISPADVDRWILCFLLDADDVD